MGREPTQEELRQAFQAGFQSLDEGETFYAGFEAFLESLGYRKEGGVRCTCRSVGG